MYIVLTGVAASETIRTGAASQVNKQAASSKKRTKLYRNCAWQGIRTIETMQSIRMLNIILHHTNCHLLAKNIFILCVALSVCLSLFTGRGLLCGVCVCARVYVAHTQRIVSMEISNRNNEGTASDKEKTTAETMAKIGNLQQLSGKVVLRRT